MDTLTIEGVSGKYDGVYECNIVGMIRDLTSPDALTGDEACYIQEQSKVRGRELVDAFVAGDARFLMALTVVVLERQGKTISIDLLMAQKLGAYTFELEPVEEDAETPHPTVGGEPSPTTSKNGGTSSSSASATPAGGPTPIGVRV